MSVSFTRTRNQLADLVLSEMGTKANGVTADSADAVLIYEAIDLRLKELHKDGIIWRKVTAVPTEFSLSAGTNSASATADILFPLKLTVRDVSIDAPVQIISPVQYAAIDIKEETGIPIKAMWKGGSEFLFWPVPLEATTAKLLYEKIMDDSSASAAPDVDVAMMRSLKNLVRYDVADHWGKAETTIARWERVAMQAEKIIRKVNALRVDSKTVAVDNFDDQPDNNQTDYQR